MKSASKLERQSFWAMGGKWLAYAGGIGAVVVLAMGLAAAMGHRLGWWDYRVALSLLRWAAWSALGVAIVSVIALLFARTQLSVLAAVWGALAGGLLCGVPWWYQQQRPEGPPMNDITTDTENPPQFVAVLPMRTDARNGVQYGGHKVAVLQQHNYGDIVPAMLAAPPAEAFARALETAKGLGWQIVAEVPQEGRIEAVDTTRFFGFKDDIVIRVTPADTGSRVDVRSLSRVGRSDFGTNARRVRAFVRRVSAS